MVTLAVDLLKITKMALKNSINYVKINMVIKIQQHMIDKKLATNDVRKVRRAMSARWPVSTLT